MRVSLNKMDFRRFPLLSCTIALFAGAIIPFLFPITPVVAVFLLVCILVFVSVFWYYQGYANNRAVSRVIVTAIFFGILGAAFFVMNDYRQREPSLNPNDFQTYVAQVAEVKSEKKSEQQVILALRSRLKGDSTEEINLRVLGTIYDRKLQVDDVIVWTGKLQPIVNAGNPGEFDAEYYYGSKGVAGRVSLGGNQVQLLGHEWTFNGMFSRWRNHIASTMETHLDGMFLGIAKALILGDKAGLDQETTDLFTNTGSMHVLAVSGLHVGLLLFMFQQVLQLFSRWITKQQALWLSIGLIWTYGFLSGASPSVMRAVFMFSIVSIGQLLNRKESGLNSLFLSAILLFVMDPWVMFDIGFQLSYAAMLGIFLLYPPISELLVPRFRLLKLIWDGTAVGLAATIFTTPLTLFWFYQFPNYFALANLGVMLFGFLVLLMGMIFLITQWIPVVSVLAAFVFSLSITGLVWWVGIIDGLPGAISSGFQLTLVELFAALLLVVGWVLFAHYFHKWKWWLVSASVVIVFLLTAHRYTVMVSNELVVFRANQFTCVLKTESGSMGFYQPKYGLEQHVPRELQSYEKYSGQTLRSVALINDSVDYRVGEHHLSLRKERDGWTVLFDGKKWKYLSYGIPERNHSPRWMTAQLQAHLNPGKHFGAYRLKF